MRTLNTTVLEIQSDLSVAYGEDSFYAKEYSEAEYGYWSKIVDWLVNMGFDKKVKRAVDLGCGYGTLAAFVNKLFKIPVECIDFHNYLHPEIADKYNLLFRSENIEKIAHGEVDEGVYDLIIFTEVLEHISNNPVPVLQMIRRMLSQGGVLMLSTPDSDSWGQVLDVYKSFDEMMNNFYNQGNVIVDRHIWQYNLKELKMVLELAGLKIQKLDYSVSSGGKHFNCQIVKV